MASILVFLSKRSPLLNTSFSSQIFSRICNPLSSMDLFLTRFSTAVVMLSVGAVALRESGRALAGCARCGLLLVLAGLAGSYDAAAQPAEAPRRLSSQGAEAVQVGTAWVGLPVGFALLTEGERQYVAYYDADRRLTVAARALSSASWTQVRLDETVAWDSHNYIAMALDGDGRLHLAGNMHGDPLNYYRTEKPHDVTTFRQINRMTGQDEQRATYPQFLHGSDGRLVFYYRDGGSGNGRRIFNVYDRNAGEWRRLLDEPRLDGRPADMNAYPHGPVRGPDGWYHLTWMWRDTPDATTNHDIAYMRSPDLVHWETAGGEPLELPITPADTHVTVDPVPPGEGLINMGFALGFDHQERPVVSYHRYDRQGRSQIYNARWKGAQWQIVQSSDWDMRWSFSGRGSISSRVGAGPVRALDDGRLVQAYHHWRAGDGAWRLDPETLQAVGPAQVDSSHPDSLERPISDSPGMEVHWRADSGQASEPGVRYVLRWETLGLNRDRERRDSELPPAQPLVVYKFTDSH